MAKEPEKTQTAKKPAPPTETPAESKGRDWYFWPLVGMGALVGVFIVGLIVALILAIVIGTDDVANVVQIVRDLFIIVLAMEGMFMLIALIVLILQIAALVNLLQSEIKPIVDNANDTVSTVKGTAQFMSENVVEPVIKFSAITAGIGGLLREALGLRRTLRKARGDGKPADES